MPILLQNAIDKNTKIFDLRTPQAVAEDNGVITGSPTFDRDGCDLNGVDQYITYAVPNTLFSSSKVGIDVEIYPDFASDEGVQKFIFDSNVSLQYSLLITSSGSLQVYLGGSILSSTAEATWGQYWKQNERNIISITAGVSSSEIFLNEVSINTGGGYTPSAITELIAGSRQSAIQMFNGKIHSINIKNDETTLQEHVDLYNNSTFNFQNKASVWLDMKSQVGKASGVEIISGGMTLGGWTAGNNAALSNPSADVLRLTRDGSNVPYAFQSIMTSTKRYRVTGQARGDGNAYPRFGTGLTKFWDGTVSNEWQEIDVIFTADHAWATLYSSSTAGTEYVEFRNISVEEVLQYTIDKSGKGNDFLLGDGSDTTKMPAFLNAGFETDGGDYMQSVNSGILDTSLSEFTMIVVIDRSGVTSGAFLSYEESDRTNNGFLLLATAASWQFYAGGVSGNDAAIFDYKRKGGKEVIVGTTTGTETCIWVNGEKGADATGPAAIDLTTAQTLTAFIRGDIVIAPVLSGAKIYHAALIPFKLTPTQIRQATQYLLNEYS